MNVPPPKFGGSVELRINYVNIQIEKNKSG
jgi:hypothetical protein